MTEKRTIQASVLRKLCIDNNYYTKGTNEEYEKLFKMADKDNLTTNDIVAMASDIMVHSELDGDIELSTICFIIARECFTIFE